MYRVVPVRTLKCRRARHSSSRSGVCEKHGLWLTGEDIGRSRVREV